MIKYSLLVLFLLFDLISISQNAKINPSDILINEFMASNASANIDVDYGNNSDWLELYNHSAKDMDISGYYLTIDSLLNTTWTIPKGTILKAGQFLLFWADGNDGYINDKKVVNKWRKPKPGEAVITLKFNHTNFKLSKKGGTITLLDESKNVLHQVKYPKQETDVSYGIGQSGEWHYYHQITPGTTNSSNGVLKPEYCKAPMFSESGGYYAKSIELEIVGDNLIKYTTNGSIPKNSSLTLTAGHRISISKSTVIRARSFEKGKLPSEVVTHTFLINDKPTLPVVSISTDSINLWDDSIGIYVKGVNGIPSYINSTRCNYFCDWERSVNIEMFQPDGSCAFNEQAGIKTVGLVIPAQPKKALSVKFRKKYGSEYIENQLFKDKPIHRFETFVLRAGQDWETSKFTDALLNVLTAGKMDIDDQAYQPVIVFLNGEYWGIHNLREKHNEHYVATNHSVNPENVDICEFHGLYEGSIFASSGDKKKINELTEYVRAHPMDNATDFEYFESQVDVNEYLNYIISEVYSANNDWPFNNQKFWRERTEAGKWRWILFDVEAGFKFHTYNPFEKGINGIFKILRYDKLESSFLQRFCAHLNTTFSEERVVSIIDSLAIQIEPEIERDVERWIGSIESWKAHVERLRQFADLRPQSLREILIEQFQLEGLVEVSFESSGGKIYVEDVLVNDSNSNFYFKGIPLNIHAIPDDGYRFVGWSGIKEIGSSVCYKPTANLAISAKFELKK